MPRPPEKENPRLGNRGLTDVSETQHNDPEDFAQCDSDGNKRRTEARAQAEKYWDNYNVIMRPIYAQCLDDFDSQVPPWWDEELYPNKAAQLYERKQLLMLRDALRCRSPQEEKRVIMRYRLRGILPSSAAEALLASLKLKEA